MSRLDLSVGQRLGIGSVAVAALIVSLGASVAVSMQRVRTLQREQAQVIAPRARAAAALETGIYQQAVAMRVFALTEMPADLQRTREAVARVKERTQRLAATPKSPAGDALFAEIVPLMDTYQRSAEQFVELVRNGAEPAGRRAAEAETARNRERVLEKVQAFAAVQNAQSESVAAAISRATGDLIRTALLVTLLIIVSTLLTSYFVVRSVRIPAVRLAAAAESLRSGAFDVAVALQESDSSTTTTSSRRFRDELREASHGFGRMAAALRARESRLAAYSRLAAVLGRSLDPRELASDALREVTSHVGAEVAALYVKEEEAYSLLPLASVAAEGHLRPLAIGEGLPGQAAAEGRRLVLRDIPADTPFRIGLGMADAPPRCIVATPMVLKDRLVGVIVVASLHDLDDDALDFVDHAAGQLAITIDNAMAHVRIASLAEELQDFNERLQAQNEELHAQGEELQAQSEELQTQSEELQTQNEELQAQSDEMRAQQEALRQTNSALARAEEQKNRFLAVLGHELRNPLAAIASAVDVLRSGRDGSEGALAHAHAVLDRQTRHLARLLDDLLDIGRITSGKVVLSRRPLDLEALARRCADTVSSNSGPERAAVRVESDGPVWVDADETRVEQIIANLLNNSIKFTPVDGSIALRVGRDAAGAFLTVSDNGAGIPPALLPHVFDFFVQGDAHPNGSNGGLGIGLTLVKHLVELHGGSVDAASAGPGQGTTLTVRMPALAGAPVALPVTAADVARLPVKRSIVVVEDNADVRQMMRLLLSRSGHLVTEAADGPAGVQAVATARPDVALVDLDLPGFDGCEVARRVRSVPDLATVWLIAVSGYGRPEDRARSLAAGFDDHLVKPIDFDRLTTILDDLRA